MLKKRFVHISVIVVLMVVGLVLPHVLTVTAQDITPWFDLAWLYRRPITVSNSNAVILSDQAVLITLGTDFDFNAAKSDGSDVRITAVDGVTQLPFWIDSWSRGAQAARLWVKVPSLAANGVQTLYMYYGNPAASSVSNGNNIFEFFDDFDTPSGQYGAGYYNLSGGQTVLQQSGWEPQAPHTLSVITAPPGGPYAYWGYYSLESCGGIGMARSNDLVNWVKDPNPLFNQEGERWPSVLHVGGTYYMVHDRDYCGTSHILLRTSSDGEHFGPYQVLVAPQPGHSNQNPNLFRDPNTNLFYLYWYNDLTDINVRMAATVEGLATPLYEAVIVTGPHLISGPNMMYYDNTYFLSTDTPEGGEWSTRIYTSTSPIGPFQLLPDTPALIDGSGCMSQFVFANTLHVYYCKQTGSTWTLDHRSADLTAGRQQVQLLDSGKWTSSGGVWTQVPTIQQDGSSGLVAHGATIAEQIAYPSFSGSDYVVEAYGKLVSGRVWGLGVRATNSSNLYQVKLYEDQDTSNNLYLIKWDHNTPSIIASAPVGTINRDTWYRMTVKAHGDNLDIYLNDVLKIQAIDPQYPSGQIGLYGEGGTVAQFNNIHVRKYVASEPITSVGFKQYSPGLNLVWFPFIGHPAP